MSFMSVEMEAAAHSSRGRLKIHELITSGYHDATGARISRYLVESLTKHYELGGRERCQCKRWLDDRKSGPDNLMQTIRFIRAESGSRYIILVFGTSASLYLRLDFLLKVCRASSSSFKYNKLEEADQGQSSGYQIWKFQRMWDFSNHIEQSSAKYDV